MFVQVIQAKVTDPAGLRKQWDVWQSDLKPNAEGFIGSTGGIAEDGTFIALARFESEEAARRNSERPEQGEWWTETAKYLEGDVHFHDCTEVDTYRDGGSDDAGFVQIIAGRVRDKARLRELDAAVEDRLALVRPDLIGSIRAWAGDHAIEAAYFTDEAAARKGEQAMDQELATELGEWMSLYDGVRFIDL